MSLLTRNQAKQKDMKEKAEVPSDENLTLEQKIDKMLNSLNTVADIQTDLRKLTEYITANLCLFYSRFVCTHSEI